MNFKLRDAIVLDNNDTDKLSRIKVQILPEQKDLTDKSKVRWIKPMFNNGSADEGEHNPPEVDSHVQVIILDNFWQEIRYLNNWHIEGFSKYDKWTDIDDIDSQTYPQPKFKIMTDGSIYFHNTETGESGTINSNGTYNVYDKDGNIFIYGKDKSIKLYDDENTFLLDNTNKLIQLTNSECDFSIDSTAKIIKLETGNESINLDSNSGKTTVVSNTVELELNGNTNTFSISDNVNSIESDPTSITINGNLKVLNI